MTSGEAILYFEYKEEKIRQYIYNPVTLQHMVTKTRNIASLNPFKTIEN